MSHPTVLSFGTVERLGPITLTKIREWLSKTDVTITPVIHENRFDDVDAHDPPRWMAEQVILRDKTCRFPYCERNARALRPRPPEALRH